MGWYVGALLLNKISIKTRVETAMSDPETVENPLDDFDYNNLLVIESKIADLFRNKVFTRVERLILVSIINGGDLTKAAKDFNFDIKTIKSAFTSACDKISYLLGNEFTDDGYIEYFKYKHKLNDEQTDKLKNIITKEWERSR
jgi:hypothetical protein